MLRRKASPTPTTSSFLTTTLPFVIPSATEGSAVSLTLPRGLLARGHRASEQPRNAARDSSATTHPATTVTAGIHPPAQPLQTSSITRAAPSIASATLRICSGDKFPRSVRIFKAYLKFMIARIICGDLPRPKALPACSIRPKIALSTTLFSFRYSMPCSVAAYSFLLPSVEETVAKPFLLQHGERRNASWMQHYCLCWRENRAPRSRL
jgi:hypothetical protein